MREAVGDDGHRFGHRGQVPVDVGNLNVPQIGRQHGDLAVDVDALGMPGLDTTHHHLVAQVVDAWGPGTTLSSPAQLPAQHPERAASRTVADAFAAVGAEERLLAARRAVALLAFGSVVTQWRQGAGMQWDQPSPATLAGPNGEHTAGQIDVGTRQCQSLADPQSGAGEQPEQGDVTVRAQPANRGQCGRGLKQVADFLIGVHMRRFTVTSRAEQPRRGHVGRPVQGRKVRRNPRITVSRRALL